MYKSILFQWVMWGTTTAYGQGTYVTCGLSPTQLTSLPQTLATGHLMGERVYVLSVRECRQQEDLGKEAFLRGCCTFWTILLRFLTRAIWEAGLAHAWDLQALETYGIFLSSPVTVYTKTIFSCRFPFAFCEGKGKEHNLFPSASSSWHITGCTERNGQRQI